jgi:hypothetical protein
MKCTNNTSVSHYLKNIYQLIRKCAVTTYIYKCEGNGIVQTLSSHALSPMCQPEMIIKKL